MKAKTVVEELNRKIFLRFGCPEVFGSDHGTALTNHVLVDFLGERGVHHTHTPPYHIQATLVECAHQTLKATQGIDAETPKEAGEASEGDSAVLPDLWEIRRERLALVPRSDTTST